MIQSTWSGRGSNRSSGPSRPGAASTSSPAKSWAICPANAPARPPPPAASATSIGVDGNRERDDDPDLRVPLRQGHAGLLAGHQIHLDPVAHAVRAVGARREAEDVGKGDHAQLRVVQVADVAILAQG